MSLTIQRLIQMNEAELHQLIAGELIRKSRNLQRRKIPKTRQGLINLRCEIDVWKRDVKNWYSRVFHSEDETKETTKIGRTLFRNEKRVDTIKKNICKGIR